MRCGRIIVSLRHVCIYYITNRNAKYKPTRAAAVSIHNNSSSSSSDLTAGGGGGDEDAKENEPGDNPRFTAVSPG